MGKWEITMNPVQEWGEECEDGVVYGITLRREPVPSSLNPTEAQPSQAYVQYRTCKVRRLKAATLNRLICHLQDPCCPEPDYGRIFLSTYRTFTSTKALIELLFQRPNAASDLDNSECHMSPLKTLIQTWLEDYKEDFRDPPEHSSLRLLLEHLRPQPGFSSLALRAEALLRTLQRNETEADRGAAQGELEQEEEESGEEGPDCDSALYQSDIMDFSVTGIAEQLTRMDSELFVRVLPYQCLGCVWSQRDKKENLSPTISATISQFNAVTNRVITSLLCPSACSSGSPACPRRAASGPAQRARVIEKWIRVAQECRQLKNFSSLKAILSALQSNAVYRLGKTWAAVSREILQEDGLLPVVDNISPKISKRCPMPRQMSTSSGVVPYLGTYLTVLTMLDTALADSVEGGLINFEKRRREFEILSQIRVLQGSCSQYNLPHHPRIAAWLQEEKLLSDQESYELSRGLEPPVDLCSQTPWSHRTLSKKLSAFLTVTEKSGRKTHADQISVSSSGSSGMDEMEDLCPSQPASSMGLLSLSSSCHNVAEAFPSSSLDSPIPFPSSSLDSPIPFSSSSSSQPDLSTPAPFCSPAPAPAPAPAAAPRAKPTLASHHKRSISMTSLPLYNRQVADSCIIRLSVDCGSDNGNMYKSILLTSQDKTPQVIQRALEKHHLEHMSSRDFSLTQIISGERELLIPEKANVFYAMSTSANYDFVLRQCQGKKKPLRATSSLGRYTK
ncbi:ral guanine nucleotide dissociation stimulator-like 1 isoform X2 [Hypomesus transpacificus]|uniref:ral guanine nucleotide dissociation stimulator-like 1 isoform X2 n=1 Tax=Hypomesus transpacificus TaxID=137520 RepID=UPI001F07F375|nr:ral guanine nucleotide dissociation stimulator-like 1 isoform X2 [Hypomesus transpacificus]